MDVYAKDPGASLDYAIDWGAGYLGVETIASSNWTVEPNETGGISIVSSSAGSTSTQATLAGGIAGNVYRVTNSVALTDGRGDERSITLRVEQR